MMDKEAFMQAIQDRINHLDFIKPGVVPEIDLYMDQVTTFMDSHLKNAKRHEEDKVLTKTMINNYAKNDLLPPPDKKKYSKDHIYILTLIYYFKNLLSISDTQALLRPMTESYFGKQDENGLQLADVYEALYQVCRQERIQSVESFDAAYELSQQAFADQQVPEQEKEYLQLLSFIAVLGFDVYLKKLVIESMIDQLKLVEAENKEKEAQNSKKDKAKSKEENK